MRMIMKMLFFTTSYVILHILFIIELNIRLGWFCQNTLPQKDWLNSVKFFTTSGGCAFEDYDAIIKTTIPGHKISY
jgi:hypothetical protein